MPVVFCQLLMKVEFSRQIFEKYPYIKLHENPSIGSRLVPCGRTDGQTDMTKITFAFSNFTKQPKKDNLTTSKSKRQVLLSAVFLARSYDFKN